MLACEFWQEGKNSVNKIALDNWNNCGKTRETSSGRPGRLSQQERGKHNDKEKFDLDSAVEVSGVCLDFCLSKSSLAESVVQLKVPEVIR